MTKKKASKKPSAKPAPRAQQRPAVESAPTELAPLTIVGVGGSAGGLEAFSQLLDAIPPNTGVAIVFVQHLSPHQESALPVLLSPHSRMPIVQVKDGVSIEANHAYVIPPNTSLSLRNGTLELSPRPSERTMHTPIDTFFASLASTAEGRVIAIVMSGTASDGALGIRDVKAAGGITIAQKPESAKYDSMPRAAI